MSKKSKKSLIRQALLDGRLASSQKTWAEAQSFEALSEYLQASNSQVDLSVVKFIKAWQAEHNYPLAALARLGRMTEGTLSQLLDGRYPKKPTKLLNWVKQGIEVAEVAMRHTPAPFDAEFPYRLTEEEAAKLEQVRSLLSVLTSLAGSTSLLHPIRQPEFTNRELYEALRGLSAPLDAVVEGYQSRMNKIPSPNQGASA